MKFLTNLTMLLLFLSAFFSCKKKEFSTVPITSLRIVNVVTGGTTARLNYYPTNINNIPATAAQSLSGGVFSLPAGNPDIYVWPITDSLKPYYNSNKGLSMAAGEYFTLFLCGTSTTPEGILVKENYQNHTDSVMGVRFINLSPNSTPVNVTLSTSTSVNEFANVAYKQISDFKQFHTKSVNATYTFQVRSAVNPGTILSSVTITLTGTSAIPRFKNLTLVFRGNVGGTGTLAPGITRVNHY
ncbi:MAG: DUF4397 domain-containing protein [Sediminibacterium sp.]